MSEEQSRLDFFKCQDLTANEYYMRNTSIEWYVIISLHYTFIFYSYEIIQFDSCVFCFIVTLLQLLLLYTYVQNDKLSVSHKLLIHSYQTSRDMNPTIISMAVVVLGHCVFSAELQPVKISHDTHSPCCQEEICHSRNNLLSRKRHVKIEI